ncbi:carbon-monoxide dehydrogenase small subunit [Serratia fonticola]|jgi:carbon-monoxide dehydrogenase small subunit|uniref:Carbon-monoxide dehydrogenase small subunit n=1 Tax=Serratia fonticola TaxID=47917 RepID=A0A542D7Z2_SERFO|nr:(2Fe-2S)-binding protein [Serratia fonticola]TQI78792.1 carbon-monoxide dehydrogenase small subunit [Serratia fonticola]TQI99186.1 carbon-monoxide dehydrogenase small subunit [Serratia fonticola]TVZ68711.1 carbon-monoxide dehydrogenase small subunit [Serratia fonticola]
MTTITMKVNGITVNADVSGNLRLLDFLRENLDLTGTKEGCSVGECGACTVIMNGKSVCSCLLLAAQCHGAEVTTIEALHHDPVGKRLQTSFVTHGGVQCGFCTPGVLLSTKALLDRNPQPSDAEIHEALEGNLCRCTGYQPIIKSIKAVLKTR